MNAPSQESRIVGVIPWLPWPISAWKWWTTPVRAERLAALRIALAGVLLLDILCTYAPDLFTYFAPDSLGDPSLFAWRTDPPRLTWSLLRGVGDPLLSFLALAGWVGTSCWIVIDLVTRILHGDGPRERDALRYSLPLWTMCGTVFCIGVWARLAANRDELEFAWIAPLGLVAGAVFFLGLELIGYGLHRPASPRRLLVMLGLVLACALITYLGLALAAQRNVEPESVWARFLSPWQNDAMLLSIALGVWIATTFLLFIGLWTRPAAIVTFAMAMSFANVNDKINNAGDTICGIILFYLMLCPCGAVWSVDRLWQRWRGDSARVLFVSPWAIRLLFVQLIFIYFCNGIYKLQGEAWREGTSLHYVLGDCTLTRFSPTLLPLPLWLTKGMSWSVLIWEVSFPFLVLHRWTRIVALVFGVGFHLGIFATMELGFFVPYALCLYVPLAPWEWLADRMRFRGELENAAVDGGLGSHAKVP